MSKRSKKSKQIETTVEALTEAVTTIIEGSSPETVELTVGQKMAKQLRDARPRYRPTTTSTGNRSLCNGDPIAVLLEGRSPEEVMSIVEGKLGLGKGALVEKYAKLNPGQKRMNAGNLLRNAVKRGEAEA